MAMHNIDTNPAALRSVASSVKTYLGLQREIMQSYLRQMSGLAQDLQVQSFQMNLEAIAAWLNRMGELQAEGERFATFLEQKATALETFQNQRI